jgi:hypothetical protein
MSYLLLAILQAWPSIPLTLAAMISAQVMCSDKKCEAQFAARIFKPQCRLFSCLPREYSNFNVIFSPVCRNPRAARVSADDHVM